MCWPGCGTVITTIRFKRSNNERVTFVQLIAFLELILTTGNMFQREDIADRVTSCRLSAKPVCATMVLKSSGLPFEPVAPPPSGGIFQPVVDNRRWRTTAAPTMKRTGPSPRCSMPPPAGVLTGRPDAVFASSAICPTVFRSPPKRLACSGRSLPKKFPPSCAARTDGGFCL